VVVDTDAHVVGELGVKQNVSPDAAMDTLRVDVFDAKGRQFDAHTFVVSSVDTWPLSFGIQPPAGGGSILVRLSAFRALFATSGTVLDGGPTLDPDADVTIERLALLDFPTTGEAVVSLTLAEDCMGIPASFGSSPTTCIDAARTSADARTAISVGGVASSAVGTWAPALDVRCVAQPGADQVCVPGGFAIIGDLGAVGALASQPAEEPAPLRPAVVKPFLLDKNEFTVGRLRALVASAAYTGALPMAYDATSNPWCTWLGASAAANDQKPVNCIDLASAQAMCAAAGRRLPTEVEWEFEARGRGERRPYPWGDVFPSCCTASLSRGGPPNPVECAGTGVEDVGSHPLALGCGNTGDVSRDGVFDMAGSVREATSTGYASYADPCWQSPGILHGPPCASGSQNMGRGSYWNAGLGTSNVALRGAYTTGAQSGFRCAADGGAP
jgi:formylglycine-generating enzyme required for sulfatase activity